MEIPMKRLHSTERKLRSLPLCALAFLLLNTATPGAFALPRLIIGIVRGFPGNAVDVPVSLRYDSNDPRDVVALQADVVFDPNGVSEDVPRGGGAMTRHFLASSRPAAGVRRLLV